MKVTEEQRFKWLNSGYLENSNQAGPLNEGIFPLGQWFLNCRLYVISELGNHITQPAFYTFIYGKNIKVHHIYLKQLLPETSFQLHMFICEYGHVILNDFLPVACVQKGLKATTLGSFSNGIWYC